jgi:kynurenine formamidase
VSDRLPSFDDLPLLEPLGLRHAWDAFGRDDELGAIGRLSAADVLRAVGTVRKGAVISLSVPLDAIDPPLYGRERLEHSVFRVNRNTWDDRLDNFYLQSSTHWDGLRHIQARELGHFGGRTDETAIVGGDGPLGIDTWVKHGFVARGVLLDVAAHLGDTFDPFASTSIDAATLDEVAAHQGVELQPHDVLCVRVGWMERYRALDGDGRVQAASSLSFAGLAADEAMARWLWDREVSAVGADNPGVEVSPGSREVGSLHRRLLPLLGITLGELFDFDELAKECRADGRWEFLLVSVPLHLVGGVGSPANAVAIR